jgi:hypothetical protein
MKIIVVTDGQSHQKVTKLVDCWEMWECLFLPSENNFGYSRHKQRSHNSHQISPSPVVL